MNMKRNNSKIITSQQAISVPTGMLVSELGSENLQRWVKHYQRQGLVVNPPKWLKLTLEDYEIMQIDTIWRAFPNQLRCLNLKDNDVEILKLKIKNTIPGIDNLLKPPSKKKILLSLDILAKLFQAELPLGTGLDLLVRELEDIPDSLWDLSCTKLTTTWKYVRTFPLPASFHEIVEQDKKSATMYRNNLDVILKRLDC